MQINSRITDVNFQDMWEPCYCVTVESDGLICASGRVCYVVIGF